MIADLHGFHGTSVPSVNTVSDCQSACVSNPRCVAVDFDPNNADGEYCWMYRTHDYQSGYAGGVNHYVLDRNCPGKHRNKD